MCRHGPVTCLVIQKEVETPLEGALTTARIFSPIRTKSTRWNRRVRHRPFSPLPPHRPRSGPKIRARAREEPHAHNATASFQFPVAAFDCDCKTEPLAPLLLRSRSLTTRLSPVFCKAKITSNHTERLTSKPQDATPPQRPPPDRPQPAPNF